MSEADDRAAVDRAFADLVAGFHKTAERPDSGQPSDWDESVSAVPEAPAPGSVFETPTIEVPQIEVSQIDLPDDEEEPEPIREERYDPGPVAPLPRPSWPVLVGWIGIGYAVLTVLVGVFGFPLPRWAAWAGVIAFAGGFGLLLSRLPRHRPPDANDGAVL